MTLVCALKTVIVLSRNFISTSVTVTASVVDTVDLRFFRRIAQLIIVHYKQVYSLPSSVRNAPSLTTLRREL